MTSWNKLLPEYETLIKDKSSDSEYLRNTGLKPNIVEMIGDCSSNRLLDIGCGDGWLLDTIRPREGYECDIAVPSNPKPGRNFSIENVTDLSYPQDVFDIVVAGLVLMWVEDLEQAYREIYRVTAPDGHAVIGITHPIGYRTGNITGEGFLVTNKYSEPHRISDIYINDSVGPLVYYHRPLSVWINTAIRAGFVLEEFKEWTVDLEDYRKNVASDFKRTDRVPMFAFLKLRKPA